MNESCCDYSLTASRRAALRTAVGVVGISAAAVFGSAFVETAYAAGSASRMLVVLSLRGAADGMSLMVPHGDAVYYQARPNIAVPKNSLLAANSYFGLHPSLAPLMPLWNAGKMAAIHATGQIVTTRSHFVAIEEVEDADPGSSARTGWLNRLISLKQGGVTPTTAVQMGGSVLDFELAGPAQALTAGSLDELKLAGPDWDAQAYARWTTAVNRIWADAPTAVNVGGNEAIGVANAFAAVRAASDSAVTYPAGDLGSALKSTAKTLKADVGAEIVTVDYGSWDHHSNLGNLSSGQMHTMAGELASAIAAFFEDLGPLADRVTLVTISEFGRRVRENANWGLDHGHGNVMFAVGGGVKGGYYGRWPGVANTDDADLAVTTDYRDVLSELVTTLYPERAVANIFPSFMVTPIGFMQGVAGNGGGGVTTGGNNDGNSDGNDNDESGDDNNDDANDGGVKVHTVEPQPSSFLTSFGHQTGAATVGRHLSAPQPTLSQDGKRAGVKVSYEWRLKQKGSIKTVSDARRVSVNTHWRGGTLSVTATYSASGYRDRRHTFKYGRIR